MRSGISCIIVVSLVVLMGIPHGTARVGVTTLYVGPSGNYSTIQAAINAAASGNIIVVDPGTYNERIVINKSLTLQGATYNVSKKGFGVPGGYAYDPTTQSIIRPSSLQDEPVVDIRTGEIIEEQEMQRRPLFFKKQVHATGYRLPFELNMDGIDTDDDE